MTARTRAVVAISALALVLTLLVTPAAYAAGEPYHVHLSWQNNPHTTVTVTWHTDQGLAGYAPRVMYGTSPGTYPKSKDGSSHSYGGATVDVHDVELTWLTPDTRYYYQCGDVTHGYSPEKSFRTPPDDDSGFTFCAFGDSREGIPFIEPNDNLEIWEQVVDTVEKENPLFNIFTGDLVMNDGFFYPLEPSMNNWFGKLEKLSEGSVFMSCHGNHEDYEDAYFDRFAFPGNERWYSFDVSGVHFVCLDTGLNDNDEYDLLSGEQKTWLESDLAAARSGDCDWIIVFFHRHPYASGGGHGDQSDVKDVWIPIFDEYGVDLVFNGHTHYYERSYPLKGGTIVDDEMFTYQKPGGTVYVTTGGAGAPLATPGTASWQAWNEKEYHYCVVKVRPGKKLSVSSDYYENGNSMEEFSISKATPPTITSLAPDSGMVGDTVTVNGRDFRAERGNSYVKFGGTLATGYQSWSDGKIEVKVPKGVSGEVGVKVTTAEGTSNQVSFDVLEAPLTWYFAEGYTGPGFQEYICLGNPTATDANAVVTYMFNKDDPQTQEIKVGANSRVTVNVNEAVGEGKDVSAMITSDVSIIAERPMYFSYGGKWPGGHDAVGARAPSGKWYFAEGTTRPGFEEWITVLNPGGTAASLTFRYMVEGEGDVVRREQVEGNSRETFRPLDHVGEGKDISLLLESDGQVVAERPIYFDYQGLTPKSWQGGHCVAGVNTTDEEWHFAEGTTRAGFEEWLCIQNPNAEDITVNAQYMLGDGQGGPVGVTYEIPAKQRLTVPVNLAVGPEKDVSVSLTSEDRFIAERPLYFSYQGTGNYGWAGGHDVLGANSPGTDWFFAEGYTGYGFEEWLCIQNPGTDTAEVQVTYYSESGTAIGHLHEIPPGSRYTILVNQEAGPDISLSVGVTSDYPVIAERPMYFNRAGWPGGHCVVGYNPQ